MSTGTDKGVIPEAFADEVCPLPRAHPDDWVVEIAGMLFLADFSEEEFCHELVHGEAVKFMRLHDWPTRR